MEKSSILNELEKDRMLYSQDILEKKLGLYQWLSSQNNILIAANTLLLGFAIFLIKDISNMTYSVGLVLALIAAGLIVFSIILCILVAIPTIKSSLWEKYPKELISQTPRTVIGIKRFKPTEYVDCLQTINYAEMIKFNADEILKTNSNIYSYRNKMKVAGVISCIGILILFLGLILSI